MNAIIQRKAVVKTSYTNLIREHLVGTVDITCPTTNSGTVYFRGDDGEDVPWEPGEWHTFEQIDLATMQIKGTVGDVVTVVGGAW